MNWTNLTDEEIVKYVGLISNASQLEYELAGRLERALDEVEALTKDIEALVADGRDEGADPDPIDAGDENDTRGSSQDASEGDAQEAGNLVFLPR